MESAVLTQVRCIYLIVLRTVFYNTSFQYLYKLIARIWGSKSFFYTRVAWNEEFLTLPEHYD
jgi:hypothetical protein